MSVIYAGGIVGKMDDPEEIREELALECDPEQRFYLSRKLESAEIFASMHSEMVDENRCFLCHKDLEYPVVYWSGSFDLLMHEPCAHRLLRGLGRDLDELIAMRAKGAVV